MGVRRRLPIGKRAVQARLAVLAARTEADLDDLLVDLIRRTRRWFLFVIAFYVASHFVVWPGADTNQDGQADPVTRWERYIQIGLKLAFWVQVGLWGRGGIEFGLQRLVRARGMQDQGGAMGATVLGFLGQMTVWSLILLLCLEALGVNVNSLIASLGVGGIAVALAAQNVLGDLFASISILLDKPFVAGDAIQVGDFVGTVERIGVKTTRLRSVDGEEIVMGNSDLVSSRIRNYKRVNERRVVCQLGVAYQTASNLAEAVPGMLREIVQGVPQARFDRAHLKALADSSILFELVYCVQSPDFNVRMDAQQAVNLAILRRFKREGIEFAYPTHTVHLVDGAPARAALAHAGAQKELSRG